MMTSTSTIGSSVQESILNNGHGTTLSVTTDTAAGSNANRRSAGANRINRSTGAGSSSSRAGTHQQYNPKLIAAQIVALQCFHYSVLAVFFQVNHVLYGTSITIDRIFTDQYVRTSFSLGWADAMAMLLSSILG